MNSATLRLTGVVSERPAVDPLHQELREVLAENDRLSARNQRLKNERDEALDQVAALRVGLAPAPLQSVLTLGRLRLSHDLRQLSLDGRTVQLTNRGLDLVAYLMARRDRVVPTDTLARALRHTDGDSVRTLIYRVRERLAAIGAERYLRSHGRSWSGGGYWMSSACEGEP